MSNETTITATNARPSTCAPEAVDIDVTVGDLSGEVTLAPHEYDGRLTSWGSPDMWVSGALLADLRAKYEDDEDADALRDVLNDLAREAAGIVPGGWRGNRWHAADGYLSAPEERERA